MLSRVSTRRTSVMRLFIGQRKASGKFEMRRLTTPEEVRDLIYARAMAEGWRPGALDHVSYVAVDRTGFFVGELDGKTISCISAVKYASNFSFLGSFIVDKQYRGKRYGEQALQFVLSSLGEGYKLGGYTFPENVSLLAIHSIKPYWEGQRFEFVADEASRALASHGHKDIQLLPPSRPLFPAILEYDTAVNVFRRHSFLEKWVFAPNSHCSVATDRVGKVVGYGVVRSCLRKEDGWSIGPLFADNSAIARSILQDMCKKVSAEDPKAIVVIDIPYGSCFNDETLSLATECDGKSVETFVRMYKGGVLENMQLKKVFGLTSVTVGCY